MRRSPALFNPIPRSVQTHMHVEQPVQHLCSLRQIAQAGFLQRLREGVEERPDDQSVRLAFREAFIIDQSDPINHLL